jgi:hypothetical protein
LRPRLKAKDVPQVVESEFDFAKFDELAKQPDFSKVAEGSPDRL